MLTLVTVGDISMSTFIIMNLISLLVVLSSDNFFVMYIMMEISNIFFYPILMKEISPPILGSGMKYFISQAVASSLFLLGSFLSKDLYSNIPIGDLMVLTALVLKMGLFPLFGWTLMVAENMSWVGLAYMMTLQKGIPLIIMTKTFSQLQVYTTMIIVATLFSMTTAIFNKFNNIRWMFVYSSNINMCWIILAGWMNQSSMMMYAYIYFILFLFLSMKLEKTNLKNLSPLTGGYNQKKDLYYSLVIYCMSGLPPLGVFLGKVEIMAEVSLYISSYTSMEGMVFIFMIFFLLISSIFVWFYSKLMISILMFSGYKTHWLMKLSIFIFWLLVVMISSTFLF